MQDLELSGVEMDNSPCPACSEGKGNQDRHSCHMANGTLQMAPMLTLRKHLVAPR